MSLCVKLWVCKSIDIFIFPSFSFEILPFLIIFLNNPKCLYKEITGVKIVYIYVYVIAFVYVFIFFQLFNKMSL